MPYKPKTHGRRAARRPDDRASASQRGYGANWQRLRKMFLRAHPLCVECERMGRLTPGELVDHIMPLADGGDNAWGNLQTLCQLHHNQKTAAERGQRVTGKIVLVSGPCGSGKSRYAREHLTPGDLVVDMDELVAAFTAQPIYVRHEGAVLPYIWAARDAVIGRLARDGMRGANAWVLDMAPERLKRLQLQSRLRAELVMLAVPADECKRRIRQDERRMDTAEYYCALVDEWWARYEP